LHTIQLTEQTLKATETALRHRKNICRNEIYEATITHGTQTAAYWERELTTATRALHELRAATQQPQQQTNHGPD